MTDHVGQQLGNYRLSRLIGRGGFAEVYLGTHLYLKTEVAIKILLAQLSTQADVESFLHEAQTIALLDHPHIIKVRDFSVEQGEPFLVMEYTKLGSLRERYPRGERLPLPLVLSYMKQVAGALQYAHEKHRLIHRDVKPGNMLLRDEKTVVLSDFGIVTIAHSTSSRGMEAMVGTVTYMAPEQMNGEPRPASDQYALAITVYEWITGKLPFKGTVTEIAIQHAVKPPPSLVEQIPTLSPAVEEVVLTALAKNPKERFASVEAFATAFEEACQGIEVIPSSPITPQADVLWRGGSVLIEDNPKPTMPLAMTQTEQDAITPLSEHAPSETRVSSQPPPKRRERPPVWSRSAFQNGDEGAKLHSPKPFWKNTKGRWVMIVAVVLLILSGGSVGSLLITHWPSQSNGSEQGLSSRQPTSTASATPTSTPDPTAQINPTATAFFTHPYVAARPGICDHGGAAWAPPQIGKISCTTDAMRLDNVGVITQYLNQFVRFDGPLDRVFPTQYTVSVHVIGVTPAWCAGLQIDAMNNSFLVVCHGQGTPCTVWTQDTGANRPCQIAFKSAYILEITYQTARAIFSIDGVQVDSVANTSAQASQTTSIEFGNTGYANAVVDYQDFTFTPQT